MAFSNQKLPSDQLQDALSNVLMEKWNEGYRDGVTSCAVMLDSIADSLKGRGKPEIAALLQSLSENFREQVKDA